MGTVRVGTIRVNRVTAALAPLVALAFVAACGGSSGGDEVTPAAEPDPQPEVAEPETSTGGASLADGAFTEAQAERGYLVFRDVCAECHGTNEMEGTDFMFDWEGSSVGRLYRVISRTMPDDDPGSLPSQSYIDVISYILQLNGYPDGSSELTTDEERLDALIIESAATAR